MEKLNSEDKPNIWEDPRFSHLVTDPRFKSLPKSEKKVKIDKRFESMFNDEKFKIKFTVDKYGRKINKSTSDDLRKYYDISSDEEEEEKERFAEEQNIKEENRTNDILSTDGETLAEEIRKKLLNSGVDFARGEGRILSDSSSDDESSDDESDFFIEHVWGELDADAETTDESTNRLAACNMDWDRLRASDIMVLCNSFLPLGGSVLSVTIYPSDFGKQRMKEEEVNGPTELTTPKDKPEVSESENSAEEMIMEEDSDVEEGEEYHMEKLRQYQLNRLKYYYAVIECDSVKTADKLYKECDGLEYESTATKLDLRFIPDDITFDDNEIKDKCSELPDLAKYKPRLFTTTALQQAKVELTWDETSLERKELGDKLASGKLDEISDADIRKVIAYSSEDEEENNTDGYSNNSHDEEKDVPKTQKEDKISKYKSLLEEINQKENEKKKSKFEMEYTWGINVSGKAEKASADDLKKKNLTPIEKALEKKHEKNKRRKEERKKKIKGISSDNEDKNNSSDEIPDGIDLSDPYFAEEFAKGDFKESKKNVSKKTKANNKKSKNNKHAFECAEDINKQELELLLNDGQDDKRKHFSLEKIIKAENESISNKKRKRNIKKSKTQKGEQTTEDDFKINTRDDRFQAIYQSHLFNIDPTDPHFKKTKGMEEFIHEKLKRRNRNEIQKRDKTESKNSELKTPTKNIENILIVKSLKRKLQGK